MMWKNILSIVVNISFIWVCVDYLKNTFKKLNRTKKIITLPLYLILALWSIYSLIINGIEILK